VDLVEGRAEALPFADRSFDAVTFTYLLRYVDDPGSTLRELARVLRPGGTIASLEFGVPSAALPRALWSLYVDLGLRAAARLLGPHWGEVGRFLGGSIRDFHRRHPLPSLLALWDSAGIEDVHARPLSFGGGVVIWGRRRA
jgi:demethylmenaquinone methyltransferase/2-methoxy-6-polyprenyl-1,4-benzoquinol methylase